MKTQYFETSRKLVFALTLAVLAAVSAATLNAQSSEEPTTDQTAAQGGDLDALEHSKPARARRLEGSWALTVTPAVPPGVPPVPPFRTYLSISRGGALVGSDRTRPFGSPQHGAWEHLGGNEFAATLIQDQFDATGNFVGTLTIRQKLTVIGDDQLEGVATAEIRDAVGNITAVRCATTKGERIKIEPLAPQCQSLTTPR